ncbi:hypothetical protein [Robertkochia aurantiaca]|nr:hypothetical protein [Robertkochia sp. 3YJGBD-33]
MKAETFVIIFSILIAIFVLRYLIGFIYVVIKRIIDRRHEDFDKRDH